MIIGYFRKVKYAQFEHRYLYNPKVRHEVHEVIGDDSRLLVLHEYHVVTAK